MLIHTDYIEPQELTGYVRAALDDLPDNRRILAQWLPNSAIDDLQYRFTAGGEGLQDAATFRAYDAESPIASRPGVTRVSGELPPISRKTRLGEYDRLRQRQGDINEQVRNVLFRDSERLTRAIAARMELARGSALTTGTVVIEENGVVATVDFGRQGNHTTAPGTLWSNTSSATVLTNLVTWNDRYRSTNGEGAGVIMTSTPVLRLMQRNAEVINAITGSAAGRTRVTVDELQALLQSESLPRVIVNDAQTAVEGVATRYVGEDFVLLLPEPTGADSPDGTDLGATLWGTTAESLDPRYALEAGEEPGIVAGVYSTEDPIALWTKAAAIGLPVLANPNLSLAADVK